MQKIKDVAIEFLGSKRIAVAGVSRDSKGPHGSNIVYRRLKERGYEVFAVNPNATEVEGDPAYPSLSAIPGGVEAVVIGTPPEHAPASVRECDELGIDKVWMHRSFGGGSVSDEAAELGRSLGMTVIDGGCPCMFGPASDAGHKVMRWMFTLNGNVPRKV